MKEQMQFEAITIEAMIKIIRRYGGKLNFSIKTTTKKDILAGIPHSKYWPDYSVIEEAGVYDAKGNYLCSPKKAMMDRDERGPTKFYPGETVQQAISALGSKKELARFIVYHESDDTSNEDNLILSDLEGLIKKKDEKGLIRVLQETFPHLQAGRRELYQPESCAPI